MNKESQQIRSLAIDSKNICRILETLDVSYINPYFIAEYNAFINDLSKNPKVRDNFTKLLKQLPKFRKERLIIFISFVYVILRIGFQVFFPASENIVKIFVPLMCSIPFIFIFKFFRRILQRKKMKKAFDVISEISMILRTR